MPNAGFEFAGGFTGLRAVRLVGNHGKALALGGGQLLHGHQRADDHADDDVGGGDAGFLAQEAQFRSVLPQPVHGLGLDLRALAGKIAE